MFRSGAPTARSGIDVPPMTSGRTPATPEEAPARRRRRGGLAGDAVGIFSPSNTLTKENDS